MPKRDTPKRAAPKQDTLEWYRRRRDFRHTPEPKGAAADRRGGGPIFVIQKHDASRLHYDLRLEVEGALKSWAVPKGPSTDPTQKRLAMPTEDHPMDYAEFEGVIPEGEYGAGPVIVWDRGTYESLKHDDAGNPVPIAKQLAAGHATVRLQGEKLRGGWALTRIARGEDERWLLVKMKGEGADARRDAVADEPRSVLSGRTIEELADV